MLIILLRILQYQVYLGDGGDDNDDDDTDLWCWAELCSNDKL